MLSVTQAEQLIATVRSRGLPVEMLRPRDVSVPSGCRWLRPSAQQLLPLTAASAQPRPP